MTTRTAKTYCRICEAHCGLEADVEVGVDGQERLVQIRPDTAHPISKGYACVKGTKLAGLHEDPDRINYPHKRVGDRYERISWAQATQEIGARVRAIRARHGDRSVGMYTGNPTFFSFANALYSGAFLEALGSPNLFASHSVDTNNKFEVSTHMYGRSLVHPVPDFDHIDFLMCLGANPAVSQMSVVQVGNVMASLEAIEARGGKVVLVDPRRTETARRLGEHVFIRPGSDVYLLLAMLHVLTVERVPELAGLRALAQGVDEFCAVAKAWTPERAAPLTGMDAELTRRLALQYASAKGAALYMSTGVNMGPFGSLAYWLLQGLNFLTGNIDCRGGLLIPRGPFDVLRVADWAGVGGHDAHRTLVDGWHRVAGAFPASALASEIDNDHPDRIRALFVCAGNPAHSVPDSEAMQSALGKLELLVAIDIYPNETSATADYLLPATDMLERSDFPISHALLQAHAYAQYTPALVQPKYERRPEWEMFSDLAIACGAKALGKSLCNFGPRLNRWLERLPGLGPITPDHLLSLLLRWGGEVTLKELLEHPSGVLLKPTQPGNFLGKRVPTPNGKVHMAPPKLLADLPRLERYAEDELAAREAPAAAGTLTLRLIGRRQRRSHNSWMHNQPEIRQPSENLALLHPDDAEQLGVASGGKVELSTRQGRVEVSVEVTVEVTGDIAAGVVAVPHGWGERTPALRRAHALGGSNVNRVIPGGHAHMDPVSGQAIMSAHRVQVRSLSTDRDT